MATMASPSYTIQRQSQPSHIVPAPEQRLRQKKMSLTQTFFLAYSARAKLSKAASQPDHDLRLLVGHANMLDALMLDLNEAEQAQKRWYSQCAQTVAAQKASRQQEQQQQQQQQYDEDRSEGEQSQVSTQHIKWADDIEKHREDWDEEVISDDDCDESDFDDDGDDEDEEEHREYSYPEHYPTSHKTSATHNIPEVYYGSTFTTSSSSSVPQWNVSTHEIVDSDSDDEDDYAIDESYDEDEEEEEDDDYLDAVAAEAAEEEMNGGLSLRRVSSHGTRAPDLLPPDLDGDAEESSDDEPILSPPQKPIDYTAKTSQSVKNAKSFIGGDDDSKDTVSITVKPLASPPLPGQFQHDDGLLPHEEGDSYFPTPIRA